MDMVLGVLVSQVKNTDYTMITLRARTMLERTLKNAICCQNVKNLKPKPDQGKAFEPRSTHRVGTCGCKPHSRAWQLRHNTIQVRLARAIPPPMGKVVVNSTMPGTNRELRQDIIITKKDWKKIMVDVTVLFENRIPTFHDARA
ncbi:hypothetical protein UY3_06980 [Chelonia mydas]|uniref:Uncharacterized protein n=1 Tax=Chelonia mydas TaxID=8469 RepID=M7BUI5_CHEMY|nr:hypothetical protein UY3_06980 [Chelonia mydas]